MTTTRTALVPHPASPAATVESLGVAATLTASGRLTLHYVLRADLARLAIPPLAPARFRDGLWRHTCFEAFVAADGAAGYRELNLSPSREWAAYAFAGYREGMARIEHAPQLAVRRDADRLELEVGVELSAWFDAPWRALSLGLAAVIETADGATSWWAIRHPLDKPDFHHRGGFALTLS